jgi:hypothetical protein
MSKILKNVEKMTPKLSSIEINEKRALNEAIKQRLINAQFDAKIAEIKLREQTKRVRHLEGQIIKLNSLCS